MIQEQRHHVMNRNSRMPKLVFRVLEDAYDVQGSTISTVWNWLFCPAGRHGNWAPVESFHAFFTVTSTPCFMAREYGQYYCKLDQRPTYHSGGTNLVSCLNDIIVHSLDCDLDRQTHSTELGATSDAVDGSNVHFCVHGCVFPLLRFAHFAGHELDRAEETRCSVFNAFVSKRRGGRSGRAGVNRSNPWRRAARGCALRLSRRALWGWRSLA
jgi:hypothetical protein